MYLQFLDSLHGKNVFLTGASRGIGEQMAYVYARAGANLFITARSEDRLQKVKGIQLIINYSSITHQNAVKLCNALVALLFCYCWNSSSALSVLRNSWPRYAVNLIRQVRENIKIAWYLLTLSWLWYSSSNAPLILVSVFFHDYEGAGEMQIAGAVWG